MTDIWILVEQLVLDHAGGGKLKTEKVNRSIRKFHRKIIRWLGRELNGASFTLNQSFFMALFLSEVHNVSINLPNYWSCLVRLSSVLLLGKYFRTFSIIFRTVAEAPREAGKPWRRRRKFWRFCGTNKQIWH